LEEGDQLLPLVVTRVAPAILRRMRPMCILLSLNVVRKGKEGVIMGRVRTLFLILTVGFVAAGCLMMETARQPVVSRGVPTVVTPEPSQAPVPDRGSAHAVIGHLKTRDRIITISTGPSGLCYTVKARDSKVLAEELAEDELYSRFPELKEVLDRGLAGDDARLLRVSGQEHVVPHLWGTHGTVVHGTELRATVKSAL